MNLLAGKIFGLLVQPPITSVEIGSKSQPSTVWQKEIRRFSIRGAIKQFLSKIIYSEEPVSSIKGLPSCTRWFQSTRRCQSRQVPSSDHPDFRKTGQWRDICNILVAD